MGGGCIANVLCVKSPDGRFLLKYGFGEVSATFAAEAEGLQALREADSGMTIPAVLGREVGAPGAPGCLLLEWIDEGRKTAVFWERLGFGLAALHGATSDRYGWQSANFIGKSVQLNEHRKSWRSFFLDMRLLPQVDRARRTGRWASEWDGMFDGLCRNLEQLLPERPEASLVHGDLWSGNVLSSRREEAVLIDPAVYYGHREVDLAMASLFGGFDRHFFDIYRETWPLEPGFEERAEMYNLYHLVNHLNLFGHGYASSVATVMKRFA